MDQKVNSERVPIKGTFLGRPSLESRIAELHSQGIPEPEIAKQLHVSSKYVHGALVVLGLD